jgi:hypothetical protein
VQPLIVVLAASLGSAGSVRRQLSNFGDRPRGENSPTGTEMIMVAAASGAALPC